VIEHEGRIAYLPSSELHVARQLSEARICPTGFVVLRGSQAVLRERASAHQYPYTLASRNRLIEDQTLAQDGDHLRFTRDTEFSSPSAAATVIHGGSANGLLAWKTTTGKTLKELEAT
jgi:Domain of unknown function (DUF4357)